MKTNLTWNDIALVAVESRLSSWVGETVPIVIVGVPSDKILFRHNTYPNPEIHVFTKGTDRVKAAQELNGVDCISFATPAIKRFLKENQQPITDQYLIDLGFRPLKKDTEWPYTMIYQRGEYTLQFKPSWGQGDDEQWMLKRNGEHVQLKFQILNTDHLELALTKKITIK